MPPPLKYNEGIVYQNERKSIFWCNNVDFFLVVDKNRWLLFQDNYSTIVNIIFNQILSPCALPEINTFYQNNEKSGTKRSEQMNWQCRRDISEQKLPINGLYPRLITPHNNGVLLCKTFLILRSKKCVSEYILQVEKSVERYIK